MNAVEPAIWTTRTTEAIKTGTWRAMLPLHIRAPSPCHQACPVGGEIAQWITQARVGNTHGAWLTLALHNPFPAIAGRVCHHPCETACNRSGHDEALAICKLERFVGDTALERGWALPRAEAERTQSVAVVGGGPSGLSAAYQLRRLGYRVTLVEAKPLLGGLMRYGIPGYRLGRDVLDGEIARIVDMGLDLRCGQPLSGPQDLARLRDEHDAVYMATGAAISKRLAPLDYDRPWVMDGAEYLARVAADDTPPLGRRLLVVGCGSAAFDVARSARRAGHDVSLLTLEAEDRLPAQAAEVAEAIEEGIRLIDSSMLKGATPQPDGTVRVDGIGVRFLAGAQRGMFTLDPVAGSDFTLSVDAIVSAIGQDPDLSSLKPSLACSGALLAVDRNGATSASDIWAGGDLASMARYVTEAVGMGERAALAIHRSLTGQVPDTDAAVPQRAVGLESISRYHHPHQPRATETTLELSLRLRGQAEVQLGLDIEAALAEADRCFSCGTCTNCDNCVTYCPDMAVLRQGDGYVVLSDYCKGCGLCVSECPSGSMVMQEELR